MEIWIISHCLRLGQEKIAHAVCLALLCKLFFPNDALPSLDYDHLTSSITPMPVCFSLITTRSRGVMFSLILSYVSRIKKYFHEDLIWNGYWWYWCPEVSICSIQQLAQLLKTLYFICTHGLCEAPVCDTCDKEGNDAYSPINQVVRLEVFAPVRSL